MSLVVPSCASNETSTHNRLQATRCGLPDGFGLYHGWSNAVLHWEGSSLAGALSHAVRQLVPKPHATTDVSWSSHIAHSPMTQYVWWESHPPLQQVACACPVESQAFAHRELNGHCCAYI